ncbi:hypothetical protein GCM10010220_69190 [Streptomyces parvulus]|nr:hypothetical protein GCM10010220_69190 [Streptomyces parvulus]
MSKADALSGSANFDAVAQPMSSRAASFSAFAGQAPALPASPRQAPNETPRVPVEQLAPNPYNPRASLAAIEEVADRQGHHPAPHRRHREAFHAAHPKRAADLRTAHYVVVDGNRCLAGDRLAGLDDVPVHVDDSLVGNADTLLETALTAAVQYENLEPLDEARALQRLVDVHGSQRAVARSLGKWSPECCPHSRTAA